jgi:hypothetical protein
MSRHGPWLLLISSMLVGAGGCEASSDSEPLVPSKQGTAQPAGDGEAISESEACERIREARANVSEDLDCQDRRLACPESIRPAGADPCERYLYDEGSVDACVKIIEDYASCDDFDRTPCLVTALVQSDAQCGQVGVGGSSGAGGQGGAPSNGSGGSGTSAGGLNTTTGGTSGEAGAGGQGAAGADGEAD